MALYDTERRNSYNINKVFGLGVLGVSAYNCTRMGVLSKTGRVGSVAGVLLGLTNIAVGDAQTRAMNPENDEYYERVRAAQEQSAEESK